MLGQGAWVRPKELEPTEAKRCPPPPPKKKERKEKRKKERERKKRATYGQCRRRPYAACRIQSLACRRTWPCNTQADPDTACCSGFRSLLGRGKQCSGRRHSNTDRRPEVIILYTWARYTRWWFYDEIQPFSPTPPPPPPPPSPVPPLPFLSDRNPLSATPDNCHDTSAICTTLSKGNNIKHGSGLH